ncbi:MAG: SUF system NifU family Fe-S cluster assembly protein [Candidatus Marinimicrobia bacterium]|nr:SUF system NifU family Fe-S cluster assembly protein [Candidatus Neomarinimicrobiota bacterium]MCF7921513.1 SUF system NifU family Fe-S cluster assembly protein [Candidatus Neomarinimicrobiota bacterium]
MSELRELYQEVILDHNKNPRNFMKLKVHSHHANGHNPLCGDKLELYLDVVDGVIKDISFVGSGCAISTSSASLMTQFLKGKTVDESRHYFESFHDLVTGKALSEEKLEQLGKLAVFAGVQEFPARIKCASLSWHTLMNALDSKDETAATE